MPGDIRQIARNVQRVRERMAEAAQASGRSIADVTMVAVTKYVQVAHVEALIAAGCRELGESRPQELWSKAESLQSIAASKPVRWHLVGHLQRNKVTRTLPWVTLVHSIDSVRLLDSVDEACRKSARQANVLLEVNISGETAKHGFLPEQLNQVLEQLPRYRHVKTLGLMAMAGLEGGRDRARDDFSRLRQLRDQLRDACPPAVSLEELSMGMSDDFDLAIEEGATIVRVGSALFEGVIA